MLLHLGMIIVGLLYTWAGQMRMDEITGGAPYGATTLAGNDGLRQPSANELEGARFQGRHVAEIAPRLHGPAGLRGAMPQDAQTASSQTGGTSGRP